MADSEEIDKRISETDTVTLRQGNQTIIIPLDELTEAQFDNLSFAAKMKAMGSSKYVDTRRLNETFFSATALFFYTTLTLLYVTFYYYVPDLATERWPDNVEVAKYWMRVAACFIYISIFVNWMCVISYSSAKLVDHRDQPNLRKTLWEDYDEALKRLAPRRSLKHGEIKEEGGDAEGKSKMIPYDPEPDTGLQWRHCMACKEDAPPRTHHCPLCNRCILKRDHHCFMTGVCIGYWNQRYFIVEMFYSGLACCLGVWCSYRYLKAHYFYTDMTTWWDVFLPFTVYKLFIAWEMSAHIGIMISHFYILTWVGGMSCAFFGLQWATIILGITSREFRYELQHIKCNIPISERIADVFGRFWLLNFILPVQVLFKQEGDGFRWPGVIDHQTLANLKEGCNKSEAMEGVKIMHVS